MDRDVSGKLGTRVRVKEGKSLATESVVAVAAIVAAVVVVVK